MKNLICVAALALLAAGCTPPRLPIPNAVADPSVSCFGKMINDEQFIPLRSRMAIDLAPQEATLAMFGNTAKPTAGEIVLIGKLDESRQSCFRSGSAYRSQILSRSDTQLRERESAEVTRLTAQLYGGSITYGEFNSKRAELDVAAMDRQADLTKETAKSLAELDAYLNNTGKKVTTCVRRGATTRCESN